MLTQAGLSNKLTSQLTRMFTWFSHLSLRLKLLVAFLFVTALAIGIVAAFTDWVIRAELTQQTGTNLLTIAAGKSIEVGQVIEKEVDILQTVTLNKLVQDAAEAAGTANVARLAELETLEEQWAISRRAGDQANPLVWSVINNPVADELREFKGMFSHHIEILVTDRYGLTLAATRRTSDYYQADETWWQSAYNHGRGKIFISQPEFDERTGAYGFVIALPLLAHNRSEVVGVLRTTLDIEIFTPILAAGRFGQTGRTDIYLPDGRELEVEIENDKPKLKLETYQPHPELATRLSAISPTYIEGLHEEQPSLMGGALVTANQATPDSLKEIAQLGWVVVVSQVRSEALQSVESATWTMLGVALGALVMTGLLALMIAQFLTLPITRLTRMVTEVTQGNLNALTSIEAGDEIGMLATSFNRMTTQLRSTLTGLEQRIAERTRDLELAAEIGRRLSAVHDLDQLLAEAVELIRGSFKLYYTQIYLIDSGKRSLILRAGSGPIGEQLRRRGHRLGLNLSSINGTAATEKRPVIVSDISKSVAFLPNPLLPDTRSEMAVPLMVGERVVGVLNLQHHQSGTLTEDILPAFEVMAGQLAIAIENANLFARTEQARAETEAYARRLARQGWDEFLNGVDRGEQVGLSYTPEGFSRLAETLSDSSQAHILTMPLTVGHETIGQFQLEGEPEHHWRSDEAILIAAVAKQAAQRVENLRLLAQAEQYRAEAEAAMRRLTQEGWADYINRLAPSRNGFCYNLTEVLPLDHTLNHPAPVLSSPLIVHGETIGELAFVEVNEPDDEATELLAIVAEQLSTYIENVRLLEETERSRQQLEQHTAELEQANRFLDSVIENVPTMLFIKDAEELRFVRWNRAAEALVGFNREEVLGKNDYDFFPPETADFFTGKDREVLAGDMVIDIAEEPIQTAHKGIRYLHTRKVPIHGSDGRPKYLLGISEDITERKRMEEALVTSEERYNLATEGSEVGLWDWDIAKDQVYFNPRWKSMLGYNDDEVENNFEGWQKLCHPDDRGWIVTAVQDHLEGRKPEYEIIHRLLHKDGKYRWVRTRGTLLRDENGRPSRWIGTNVDITAQKQAEEEVAQRANELQTVAEVSAVITTILETGKLLQSVVDLTKESFGLSHAQIYLLDEVEEVLTLAAGTGEAGQQLVSQGWQLPLDPQRSLAARAAWLKQGAIANDILPGSDLLPNPSLPDTRSEMAVPLVVGEKVLGILDVHSNHADHFTIEDIHIQTTLAGQIAIALQNTRLFEESKQTAQRLREMDRLKSEFLANMSHELRTPLNSIIGYSEMILLGMSGELNEELAEEIRAIFENGKHLLNLISDILDLAKIEAGRLQLRLEKTSIQELLYEIKVTSAGLFLKKPIELIIETEPDLPVIIADPVRVNQILNNLLSNAAKFTEQGTVHLRAFREEGWLCLAVADTGIGIGPEDLQKIFEKFMQVDGSFTRRAEGTGLGLAITRHLIHMHGGKIDVRSQLGQGTTFIVRLPIRAEVDEII